MKFEAEERYTRKREIESERRRKKEHNTKNLVRKKSREFLKEHTLLSQ